MPSVVLDFPNHARLLDRIHEEDLSWETKEWPSADADQFQERFAYGSTTLGGARSYLAEMSKVPLDDFIHVEDITYDMGYRWLQQQLHGPIYKESTVNYVICLINMAFASERFSRDSRGPEEMENILQRTRDSLWKLAGIQECSPEQTTPRPKQRSWAKECRVILNGLHKAHSEFENYPPDGQVQTLGRYIYSRERGNEMEHVLCLLSWVTHF